MNLTDADKAYQLIKEKIITIEMPPGAVIREAQLMEELNLGRTPIREALKRLEADSLVIVTPRRGIFVAGIAITDLTQIYEVRIELEALGARLAAQRITLDQLKKMKELVEEYQRFAGGSTKQIFELDRRFHELLAQATNNKFLQSELELFYNLSLRIWYLAVNYIQPDDIDIAAHIEIFDAIETRDEDHAEIRMRRHIDHFHQSIKQYL